MYKVITSDTFKEIFSPLTFNINEVLASTIPDKTIGDKIRRLRFSLRLTQLQFAKSINRGFGTITKWEQNLTIPNHYTLSKIICIYNLPSNHFNIT
ncbi:MAG: hypothetical protein E6248_15685 [Clostridium sp.]|nr:hypothetical protein [Clostridium sp.]